MPKPDFNDDHDHRAPRPTPPDCCQEPIGLLVAGLSALTHELAMGRDQDAADLVYRRMSLATREDLDALERRLIILLHGDSEIALATRALKESSDLLAAAVARNQEPRRPG